MNKILKCKYFFAVVFIYLLFYSTSSHSIAPSKTIPPSFDCNKTSFKEPSTSIEEMFCLSEQIQKLVPKMDAIYSKFYETLSPKEQKVLEESQINWLNNLKYQGFSELNSYPRREFHFIQHYQNRINLLKEALIDKTSWTEYLSNREKNSQNKIRYLEKVEDGYLDVCNEVEKFLTSISSEIKFAKFKFEVEDENILIPIESGSFNSTLYFDIDNDGKEEIIERYSSILPGTSSAQTEQTAVYYKSENDKLEKKYKSVGMFLTSGNIELFSYKNKNYVFDIPYIIGNNSEILEFYKKNHLDRSNMEYLKLARLKEVYDEHYTYNPAYISILVYNHHKRKEVCKFSLK